MAYNNNNNNNNNNVVVKLIFLVMIMLMINGDQVKALRADMKRVHSMSMTSEEHFRGAVHRSTARLRKIEASVKGETAGGDDDVGAPINRGTKVGEFLITMSIGTPPRKMVAIVDTGSDLIWTQCKPCVNCFTQPDPVFDPIKSTTYNTLPCSAPLCATLPKMTCTPDCEYFYQYGDGSKTSGVLSNETITMWDSSGKEQAIPGVAFGCSHDSRGVAFSEIDGLLGLGRGSLSLISQIGATIGSKFSYCLTSYIDDSPSETSPLFFGNAANLKMNTSTGSIQSTPMKQNPARPDLNTFYYLSVKSVTVAGRLAAIPQGALDIREDGGGGFIIDSGTTVTYLAPDAFSAVADAMNSAVEWSEVDGSPYGFSLCYQSISALNTSSFPDMTFHLEGGGEYVVEGKYNFAVVKEQISLVCMLMLKMNEGAAAEGVPSILGNIQQQNYHILYDNGNQMLSFTPASCRDISEPAFDKSVLSSASLRRWNARTVIMSFFLCLLFYFQCIVSTA